MAAVIPSYIRKLQKGKNYPNYLFHHWADFVELVCLANLDGEMSVSDVVDRLSDGSEEKSRDSTEPLVDYEVLMESDDTGLSRRSEISDEWTSTVRDWFKLLKVREALYGESYPFIVVGNELKLKKSLKRKHKVYIFLLLCSNLYLFHPGKRLNDLANSFEMFSLNVFKNILPESAKVHIFSPNNLYKTGPFTSGLNAWERLKALEAHLNERLTSHMKEENYPGQGGDDGVDLVGWIPTGDSMPSNLIFFGQCACTTKWVEKQNSSSHGTWRSKFEFLNATSNNIFIPFCFRKADGQWTKPGDINSFLIDRKRAMYFYFKKQHLDFDDLPAASIVKEVLGCKEEVV